SGLLGARARAGETDIVSMDADPCLVMKRPDLLYDRRVGYGRGLQSVAERLVHDLDAARRALGGGFTYVPVVDEVALAGMSGRSGLCRPVHGIASTTAAMPWPPPMQALATPQRFFRRRSASRRVRMRRVPVAAR